MTEQRKVALVTGAGHGIGRAIALRLARMDFAVMVHFGKSADAAQKVVESIENTGGIARAVQGDVSRVKEIEALFAQLDEHFGRLDVLVNNAGIVYPSPLDSLSEELFDSVFSTNVKGPAFATKEAARRMGGGGRIVNISSSRAHFPAAGTTAYAGSKGALEVLTAVWSRELAKKGITVNAVAPGPTSPGMFDRAPEFLKAEAQRSSPFARIGSADEVAGVVAFLCSDDASWVTGQTVLVNGAGTI
ncbi:MAG: SDR family NAD(P)-dependent oxidoreductase [Acidiferrobacterales bacterium]